MGDYNSTLNFVLGIGSQNKSFNLNDNEYIQVKAYALNEKS